MQIVQLESPYYSIARHEMLASEYFAKMTKLRVKAFVKHHGDKSFPFAKNDFLADHLMVEYQGEVVGKYKAISMQKCKEFGIEFPILPTIKESQDHHAQMVQYLDKNSDKNIYYMGSFAEIVPDRRQRRLVRNLICLITCQYFKEKMIDEVIVTSSKQSFKFFNQLGFEKIFDDQFVCHELNDSTAHAMKLTKINPEIAVLSKDLEHFWTNRLLIGTERMDEQIQNQNDIGNIHHLRTGS